MTSGILPPFQRGCQWGMGKNSGCPSLVLAGGLGRTMLWDCLPPTLSKKREGWGTPVARRRKNQNLKGGPPASPERIHRSVL